MYSCVNWNRLDIIFALYEPNFIGMESSIMDLDNFIEYLKLNKYRKMLGQILETYLYMI